MRYQLDFRIYHRPFRQPLLTNHGLWSDRRGIILRLASGEGVGFGEIAPLSQFGGETVEQAWEFCQSLSGEMTLAAIASIPDHLPACQFGFEMAWEALKTCCQSIQSDEWEVNPDKSAIAPAHPGSSFQPTHSCLLPNGPTALHTWPTFWSQGYRTFKWKIGIADPQDEWQWFQQLIDQLPAGASLRLDANGGFTWDLACRWLDQCSTLLQSSSQAQPDLPQLEFLEQPLPASQVEAMLELSQRFPIPIALDESVATLRQLEDCYHQGWSGIFVVKAAIAGSPQRLRQFCQKPDVDIVWSSALETTIARQFILTQLIPSVPQQQRAIGFGVDHWFADNLHQMQNEQIWQSL
jgi:O-succinylbenzoate synthase